MPSALTDPRTVARAFRAVAIAEAVSWVLLLAGMFVKWVLRTSELGVQLAGPVHGAVFVCYVLVTLAGLAGAALVPGHGAAGAGRLGAAVVHRLVRAWARRTGRLPRRGDRTRGGWLASAHGRTGAALHRAHAAGPHRPGAA